MDHDKNEEDNDEEDSDKEDNGGTGNNRASDSGLDGYFESKPDSEPISLDNNYHRPLPSKKDQSGSAKLKNTADFGLGAWNTNNTNTTYNTKCQFVR